MSADKPVDTQPAPPTPQCGLTEVERRALRELLDELVEATDDRVFWLGRVRETALEMRRRLSTLLEIDERGP